MLRRVAVALVVSGLAATGAASASADVTGDPGLVRIARRSLVPLPKATVSLGYDTTGGDAVCPDVDGCSWWQHDGDGDHYTVLINPYRRGREPHYRAEVVMHEIGHMFDQANLDNAGRARFKRLFHLHGPWGQERPARVDGNVFPVEPDEWFADGYSLCALKSRIKPLRVSSSYGYMPTPRQHRRVCALIRSYR